MVEKSGTLETVFDVEVYYEDTDLSGFVYHSNYLKYFERAREHGIGREYLCHMLQQKMHFVVSKASLKYIAPAHFGDQLVIKSVGSFSRSPALDFKHSVFRKGREDDRPLVVAEVTLVLLNESNKPKGLPDNLIEHLISRAKCVATHSGGQNPPEIFA